MYPIVPQIFDVKTFLNKNEQLVISGNSAWTFKRVVTVKM